MIVMTGCKRLMPTVCRFAVALLLVVAAAAGRADRASLQARYLQLKDELKQSKFESPIYIQSKNSKHTLRGEVYGIVKNPNVAFEELRGAFTTLENWCKFIPLHLNVKTCTYHHNNGASYLTFYVGGKYYAKPDEVYALRYRFRVINKAADYFKVLLTAKKGPSGTRKYRLQLDAMEVNGRICYRVISSYQTSAFSRFGTKLYLKTAGSKKIGFSVIGADDDGDPIYIKGIKGIIERNVIRYYLAGKAFIATQHLPPDKQFEARIRYWFKETERYHRQLYEMKKKTYLRTKRRERTNQLRLQQALND